MALACCGQCFDIGCFDSCNDVESGLIAAVAGVHTILYEGRGGTIIQTQTDVLSIGEEIIFSNIFRETGKSKFQILDPNMDNYEHTSGTLTYDHFCLTNLIFKP